MGAFTTTNPFYLAYDTYCVLATAYDNATPTPNLIASAYTSATVDGSQPAILTLNLFAQWNPQQFGVNPVLTSFTAHGADPGARMQLDAAAYDFDSSNPSLTNERFVFSDNGCGGTFYSALTGGTDTLGVVSVTPVVAAMSATVYWAPPVTSSNCVITVTAEASYDGGTTWVYDPLYSRMSTSVGYFTVSGVVVTPASFTAATLTDSASPTPDTCSLTVDALTLSATTPSACGPVTTAGAALNTLAYAVSFTAPAGHDSSGVTANVVQATSATVSCVDATNTLLATQPAIAKVGTDSYAAGIWTTTWASDLSALTVGSACEMTVTVTFTDGSGNTSNPSYVTATLSVTFRIE